MSDFSSPTLLAIRSFFRYTKWQVYIVCSGGPHNICCGCPEDTDVLSESLMHLALRLIFRRRCLNFINVRTAYASKIQAPPTKNPLANSGTTRFQEHIRYTLGISYAPAFAADFPGTHYRCSVMSTPPACS